MHAQENEVKVHIHRLHEELNLCCSEKIKNKS